MFCVETALSVIRVLVQKESSSAQKMKQAFTHIFFFEFNIYMYVYGVEIKSEQCANTGAI